MVNAPVRLAQFCDVPPAGFEPAGYPGYLPAVSGWRQGAPTVANQHSGDTGSHMEHTHRRSGRIVYALSTVPDGYQP